MRNYNAEALEPVSAPSIIWALVSKKTGKVRSFAPTREAARLKKDETLKVLRYVADFTSRA